MWLLTQRDIQAKSCTLMLLVLTVVSSLSWLLPRGMNTKEDCAGGSSTWAEYYITGTRERGSPVTRSMWPVLPHILETVLKQKPSPQAYRHRRPSVSGQHRGKPPPSRAANSEVSRVTVVEMQLQPRGGIDTRFAIPTVTLDVGH